MDLSDHPYKEVYFDKYCTRCVHYEEDDYEGGHCNECLHSTVNLYSHKPVLFKEK